MELQQKVGAGEANTSLSARSQAADDEHLVISWVQLTSFLDMAQAALEAKNELIQVGSEDSKVVTTSSRIINTCILKSCELKWAPNNPIARTCQFSAQASASVSRLTRSHSCLEVLWAKSGRA